MGLFSNPLGYAGYPPGVTGTPETQNSTVRAATITEANDALLDNVYISPVTAQAATTLDFASPPVGGFGSTTPRPVHATTLDSTGNTSLGTGAASVVNVGVASSTIGFFGATAVAKPANTDDLRTALINLGLYTTGGATPLNLNGGAITCGGLTASTGDIATSAGNANITGNVVASKSSAGANVTVQATNSDNTNGASNAGVEIASGGASGGDPYLSFQISGVGASTVSMGLDNSDSDAFVMSNSTALGTSNMMRLTQAGALTMTSSITSTAGDITATLGNVVVNGAAKQYQCHGGAATDFIGQATLINGVATVLNTNIAATDRVFVSRSAKNASTAYGVFEVTVNAATSFVITACKSDTTTETNDQSTVDYFIVRQV